MIMKFLESSLVLLVLVKITIAIVNPNNETARIVIYLETPNNLGPRTWLAGTNCLDRFTAIYLKKREKLTRSPNVVLSSVANMSTPAAQIQEGFLKLMMESISEMPPKRAYYQYRIVADSKTYSRNPMSQRELLLADYYIIIVDTVTRLKRLMRNYVSTMLSWNPGAKFLILFHNPENRRKEIETARLIFEEMLFNFYVHRVAILYATSAVKYTLLLMDYYNVTSCRHLEVKAFATCEEGTFTPSNMALLELQLRGFLNSITLNNCTFYMCASIAAPFIEDDCINGLELRVIGFIKNRLKFEIEQTCEHENRGIEEKPGNWTGLLGRLNERSCDFIVGGYYPDNDVIQSFWVSDTYFDDSYTWFVEMADPRPPWMALYIIFQNFTWLSCLAMLLLTWFIWYILLNFLPEPRDTRELSLVAINNLAVTICVSVNERPICLASRFFFVLLALYGLTLASTYTSKLIAVFSNPGFLHQITSLHEVKEAGIPYGGYQECRDWFENEHDMWIFNDYNDTAAFEPSGENLESVKQGERVILSSRMYILQSALSDNIFAFSYNVFSSPLQMIMKPGFPFIYEFNWMIRYMRDFGFLAKIHNDFQYRNTYLNRFAKMRPEYQDTEIVLTPEHLQGSFAILTVGLIISMILFMVELLIYYVILPGWHYRYKSSTETTKPKNTNAELQVLKRKRKFGRKTQKGKLKRNTQQMSPAHRDKEIVIMWHEDDVIKEVPIQKGVRFTPLKRRIIQKREDNRDSDGNDLIQFLK